MSENGHEWPAVIASATTVVGATFFQFMMALTDTRNLSQETRDSWKITHYVNNEADPPRVVYFLFGVGTFSAALCLAGVGLGLATVEAAALLGILALPVYWVVGVYGYLQLG